MRIYIAGPISAGDQFANVGTTVGVMHLLLDAGHAPYCPHLSAFVHYWEPRPYEDWMRLDLEWLEQCQAVLRLPGESPGADREVARALELGLPVYYDLEGIPAAEPAPPPDKDARLAAALAAVDRELSGE